VTVGYLRYMSSLVPSGAAWNWLALAEGRKEDMGNCFPMPCAPYTSLYGGLTHSRAAIKHHDAGSKLTCEVCPWCLMYGCIQWLAVGLFAVRGANCMTCLSCLTPC
jgi:hypothetical protein